MADRGDALLGRTLREWRQRAQLTQAEVAAAVGKSRGHIAAIESGKRPAGRDTLMAYARELGLSLDFLASRQGAPGDRAAKTELEVSVLLALREMPPEEAEMWARLLLMRIKDRLNPS